MSENNKVRWLQISDLHFGNENEYCKKSREALKKYVINNKNNINYIFVTGDIIYAKDVTLDKREKAYKEAKEYIFDIYRAIWGNNITVEEMQKRIFFVPGNHDLIRDDAREDYVAGMNKKYEQNQDGQIDRSYLVQLNRALEYYYNFYNEFVSDDYITHSKEKIHYVVETEFLNILHINTCISSCNNEDAGNLLIGHDLISKALDEIDDQKPTIAIAHHNFGVLSRSEQEKLEILLKKHNISLYLCGHAHERESELILKYNQIERLYSFTCGTLMSLDGKNKYIDTVFFEGELDLKLRNGRISSFKWDLANEWHEDMDFGLVQGIKQNYRTFLSDSIDVLNPVNLSIKKHNATGVYSQIVTHQSLERQKAFLDLNENAERSLSIYGIGISSVSKKTELLDRILQNQGIVRLCMVDPNVFKKESCIENCKLNDTNFCVFSEHIDQYIRSEYYEDICKSFERALNYKKKANEHGWNFEFRVLKSFIPISINIINENEKNAALIIEYNMPFTNKRLLIQTNNGGKDADYFQQLCNVFRVIWEKAVEIRDNDN